VHRNRGARAGIRAAAGSELASNAPTSGGVHRSAPPSAH
jgi:hypothetical protein